MGAQQQGGMKREKGDYQAHSAARSAAQQRRHYYMRTHTWLWLCSSSSLHAIDSSSISGSVRAAAQWLSSTSSTSPLATVMLPQDVLHCGAYDVGSSRSCSCGGVRLCLITANTTGALLQCTGCQLGCAKCCSSAWPWCCGLSGAPRLLGDGRQV